MENMSPQVMIYKFKFDYLCILWMSIFHIYIHAYDSVNLALYIIYLYMKYIYI